MTRSRLGARRDRERRTVAAMIAISCGDRHASGAPLCGECSELEAYTRLRLEKCPYGEEKPTCVDCPIHCYQPLRREQIRGVMAYSGPRMLLSHPVLAIRHMIDGRRKAPQRPARSSGPMKS
jgi:Nitrous oxide-stimulated promoter